MNVISEIKWILGGDIGPGVSFSVDGQGGVSRLDFPGPDKVLVELFAGEQLGLDEVRESIEDLWQGARPDWRLLDDDMPGVYGLDLANAYEVADTLAARPGVYTLATLEERQVCHKCSEQDCYLNTEAEEVGLLLLEPTPF